MEAAWEKCHINMPSWNNTEKDKFLSKWCSTRHQKNGMRKVFDLHCDNPRSLDLGLSMGIRMLEE